MCRSVLKLRECSEYKLDKTCVKCICVSNSLRVTISSLKSVFINLPRVVHFTLHGYSCVVKFHCFASDCQRRAQKLQ
jgi:hypothetical protein